MLELFEAMNPPAMRQEKRKYANFTVKDIGGPKEIIEWRQKQASKEGLYNTRLYNRDGRLRDFEAKQGVQLAHPTLSKNNWQERLDRALSERKNLAQVSFLDTDATKTVYDTFKSDTKGQDRLVYRVIGWVKRLLKTANFSNE